MKNKYLICALAMSAVMALPFNAYADSETSGLTKITTVRLIIDTVQPASGDNVEDHVNVTSDTEGVIITDAYYDNDDDEWERTTSPVLKVEMDADNGYYFGSVKLGGVSGLSKISSKSIKKDGDKYHCIATIKLKKLGGRLDYPEDPGWSGSYAEWEDIEGASYYNVRLRRDDKKVVVISTNETRFDFFPWMTKSGDYTFEVKAMAGKTSENSEWGDESDSLDIGSGEVYNGVTPNYTDFRHSTNNNYNNGYNNGYSNYPYNNSNYGPSSTAPAGVNTGYNTGYQNPSYGVGNGTSGAANPNGQMPNNQNNMNQYNNNAQGSWNFDGVGYKFYKGGVEVKYSWVRDGSLWYYIGQDGYMKTGWQTINGKTFYMAPEAGAPMGCMRTGWQFIDNQWYYLGTNGEMQTGYQTINGKNYYLNENGVLLVNGTAPNGKTAGADGVLN